MPGPLLTRVMPCVPGGSLRPTYSLFPWLGPNFLWPAYDDEGQADMAGDAHDGDVKALKAAELWLFSDAPAKQSGKTGLPGTGTASDNGRVMKRWRGLAGLDDPEGKEWEGRPTAKGIVRRRSRF